jgi:hypothetical protein
LGGGLLTNGSCKWPPLQPHAAPTAHAIPYRPLASFRRPLPSSPSNLSSRPSNQHQHPHQQQGQKLALRPHPRSVGMLFQPPNCWVHFQLYADAYAKHGAVSSASKVYESPVVQPPSWAEAPAATGGHLGEVDHETDPSRQGLRSTARKTPAERKRGGRLQRRRAPPFLHSRIMTVRAISTGQAAGAPQKAVMRSASSSSQMRDSVNQ